ncbi:MAG: hypothetical protein ACQET7_06730 [Thermodesulfobacteriota bacterium]
MVFFANLGVNLRGCLCGVLQYAEARGWKYRAADTGMHRLRAAGKWSYLP